MSPGTQVREFYFVTREWDYWLETAYPTLLGHAELFQNECLNVLMTLRPHGPPCQAPRMITQTTPCLFSWCLLLCSGVRLTSGQIAKSSYRYTALRVPVSQLTIEVTSLD